MKFTGERFVPEVHGDIELEHRHRYLQACTLAKGKVVLDIASGEGYGSAMLAEHALQVIGVDISEHAVAHAQQRYQGDNLEYRVGSCAAIPLADASVDLLVSFETIEHHDQHQEMMQEIRRVLRKDGILLISSPDKMSYSDVPGSHNEFHVKELYQHEFKQLLEGYFDNITYFGQRILFGSGIFAQSETTALNSYWQQEDTIQITSGMAKPLYWIALASNQTLPQLEASFFEKPIEDADVVSALHTAVEHRENDVVLHKKWVAHLENDIAIHQQRTLELQNSLQEQIESVHNAATRLQQYQQSQETLAAELTEIKSLHQQSQAEVKSLHQQLKTYQQSVIDYRIELQQSASRETELGLEISNLQNQLSAFNGKLAGLTCERDHAFANIAEIRASRSWRWSAPLRGLRRLIRGETSVIKTASRVVLSRAKRMLPRPIVQFLKTLQGKFLNITAIMPHSSMNQGAIASMVAERCAAMQLPISVFVPPVLTDEQCPRIDLSIVTYNSSRWIDSFVASLLALDYPKTLLSVFFVDNSSTDDTLEKLQTSAQVLCVQGIEVAIQVAPNNGFGAGHNVAFKKGSAPYCLVTNLDLTFETDALRHVVSTAVADVAHAAAWELRQKPYEHPKYYDPITGSTNWNSHACVLLRRSAIQAVGGFDETLFMYGEDVELSYRLRRAGHVLRYCPQAVVWHFTYETVAQVKPLQYTGSTFANLYLRLKYGNRWDALAVPLLGLRLLLANQAYPDSRLAVARNLLRLLTLVPKILWARKSSNIQFPFREWDYEMIRDGAFIALQATSKVTPLVSIITRTYRGRELYLRQAVLSVARQTYPNIEHIIVEDGGDSMQMLIDEMQPALPRIVRYFGLAKCGRSATGNHGLRQANGRWCLFLDDDDLLFADHVEVLVNTMLTETQSRAAYTLAWEVPTDSSQLAQGSYREMTYQVPTPLRQIFDYDVLRHHNFMPIQSVLFERSLYLERGGFDEDMDALEDWTLWVRYAHKNQFTYVPKLTSLFRVPENAEQTRQRSEIFAAAYPLALTRNSVRTEAIDAMLTSVSDAEKTISEASTSQPERSLEILA
ncbi:glycosyltransferase [Undibacterium amnicola]|uniref:Glycosyltransferase n=1 Tax=Undibacterium amnicola TaxID=1834038 RepID=A0ABR6XPG3_9BURK|nr:glycosyltransferase [Undibacterium amnicola]MBC3831386.1 glycosyltransferase [Undibacterium amnicola]